MPDGEYISFVDFLSEQSRRILDLSINRWGFETLKEKLTELAMINSSIIDYAFLGSKEVEKLRWRNATLRDFFAALFLVRNSTNEHCEWTGARTSILETDSFKYNSNRSVNLQYHKMWQFVVDMPSAGESHSGNRFSETRIDLLRHLFARSTLGRPTELMNRAWPRLLRWANWLDDVHSTQEEATRRAQNWAWNLFDPEKPFQVIANQTNNTAREIVDGFLSEYPRILFSSGDVQASRICREDGEQLVSYPNPEGIRFLSGYGDQ